MVSVYMKGFNVLLVTVTKELTCVVSVAVNVWSVLQLSWGQCCS